MGTLKQEIKKAIDAHNDWKKELRKTIQSGKLKTPVNIIERDTECEFGKWLYNDATAEFKSLPIYREIKDIHAKFHMEAGRVLALAVNGKKEEAKKGIGLGSEFRRLSSTLVLKLSSLKTRK